MSKLIRRVFRITAGETWVGPPPLRCETNLDSRTNGKLNSVAQPRYLNTPRRDLGGPPPAPSL